MKISLSQFMAYTAKTTTDAKIKEIRKIKNDDYTFSGDYWMALRTKFHKVLQGEMTFEQLETFAKGVDEAKKKRKNYMAATSKLKAFFSRKSFKYQPAPRARWTSADKTLTISCSPEFILEIDGLTYLIKVFYRLKKTDEKLTKRNIASTLHLMDTATYDYQPDNAIPAILNLQTKQLVTLPDLKGGSIKTLEGDIAMFKALWEIV